MYRYQVVRLYKYPEMMGPVEKEVLSGEIESVADTEKRVREYLDELDKQAVDGCGQKSLAVFDHSSYDYSFRNTIESIRSIISLNPLSNSVWEIWGTIIRTVIVSCSSSIDREPTRN